MKKHQLALWLCAMLLGAANAWAADSGTALKNDEIKAEPFRDAKKVGALAKGDTVDILGKDGGWLKVKSAKGSGWVHMLSIRRGEARKASEASGLLSLASGRAGTGAVVSTTGIRGLDTAGSGSKLSEDALKAAKFNEAELMRDESYAVSKAQAQQFARQGGLAPRPLDYLPAPK